MPATVAGLAGGMLDLLRRPDELRQMGLRLQAYVRAEYGIESVIRRYLGLFEDVLRARGVCPAGVGSCLNVMSGPRRDRGQGKS